MENYIIERACEGEQRANSYLVIKNNRAILIDASLALEKLEQLLKKNNAKLDCIFITHAHFDHILNLEKIDKKYGVKIYISKPGFEYVQDINKNLSYMMESPFVIKDLANFCAVSDMQEIECLGGEKIKVLETPGHCESCLCFKIGDYLFTGDTLFYNTIGRCDLWNSSEKKMKESLIKLNKIDAQKYFAGHGLAFTRDYALKTIDCFIKQLP